MKGTLCAALFSEDSKWYRVKVLGSVGSGNIKVEFIDYGNQESVTDSSLRKLPAHLLAFEAQAMQGCLAFLRAPKLDQTMGPQAGKYVQRHGLNMVHDAIVVNSESGAPLELILMEEGESDWSNSLNAFIVSEGLAILDRNIAEADLPEQVTTWNEFEDEARHSSKGLW